MKSRSIIHISTEASSIQLSKANATEMARKTSKILPESLHFLDSVRLADTRRLWPVVSCYSTTTHPVAQSHEVMKADAGRDRSWVERGDLPPE